MSAWSSQSVRAEIVGRPNRVRCVYWSAEVRGKSSLRNYDVMPSPELVFDGVVVVGRMMPCAGLAHCVGLCVGFAISLFGTILWLTSANVDSTVLGVLLTVVLSIWCATAVSFVLYAQFVAALMATVHPAVHSESGRTSQSEQTSTTTRSESLV